MRTLFESDNENYYQQMKIMRIFNAFNGNYIEYGSNGDKMLSIKEYLNEIKPYLIDIRNEVKN